MSNRYHDDNGWGGADSAYLHPLYLDDTVDVRVSLVASSADVIECFEQLGDLSVNNLVVLVHSRWVAQLLHKQAATDNVHVVSSFLTLIWVPEDPWQMTFAAQELWHLLRSQRSNIYQIAIDANNAVTNSVSRLRVGDTCAILWPAEYGLTTVSRLVAEGRRKSELIRGMGCQTNVGKGRLSSPLGAREIRAGQELCHEMLHGARRMRADSAGPMGWRW